jgi:hypothetical protein
MGAAPVGVALGPDRRGLVHGQGVGLGPGQHRPERPVHVHAGHHQQAHVVADDGKGGLGVRGRPGAHVDQRLGVELVHRAA